MKKHAEFADSLAADAEPAAEFLRREELRQVLQRCCERNFHFQALRAVTGITSDERPLKTAVALFGETQSSFCWDSPVVLAPSVAATPATGDIPSVISEYLAAPGGRAWQYTADQSRR